MTYDIERFALELNVLLCVNAVRMPCICIVLNRYRTVLQSALGVHKLNAFTWNGMVRMREILLENAWNLHMNIQTISMEMSSMVIDDIPNNAGVIDS